MSGEEEYDDDADRAKEMADDYAAVLELLASDAHLDTAWKLVELERSKRRQAEKAYERKVAELAEMTKEAKRWKTKALSHKE